MIAGLKSVGKLAARDGLYGAAAEQAVRLARGPVLDIVMGAIWETPTESRKATVVKFLKSPIGSVLVAVALLVVLFPMAEFTETSYCEKDDPDDEDEERVVFEEGGLPANKIGHLVQALATYVVRKTAVLATTRLFQPLRSVVDKVTTLDAITKV